MAIKPHEKCNFLNEFNFLIIKADSLQREDIFPKRMNLRSMISHSLFWLILIIELYVTFSTYSILADTIKPFAKCLIFISVTTSRFVCATNEILALLICTDLEVRFFALNKEIRSFKPPSTLFLTKLSKITQQNKIEKAMVQFSSLSIALKSVNQHFGFFWAIILAQLCMIMLVILAVFISDPIIFTNSSQALLLAITVIRIMSTCFVCGNTSHEVCN
jgi:hypothetical protein